MTAEDPEPPKGYGWSFEETERGLDMTPLERLRWLDRRKKELQSLLGRAAEARPEEQRGERRGERS